MSNTSLEIKADFTVTETGEITGIAWPWGVPDSVGDVMNKGALTAPDSLPMLWAHDQSQVIGVWDQITNTAEGLMIKGRLLLDSVPKAAEVYALLQAKAVTGLSIGFHTQDAKRTAKGRTILAAALKEISIVAVPCHPGAQITSLKSDDDTTATKGLPMPDQPETEIETKDAAAPASDAPQADTKAFDKINKRLDAIEAKSARPQGVHISSPNVIKEDEKKSFTTFLRTGEQTEVKALAVSSGTGGILAPETVANTILEQITEFSPLRQLSNVIQMNGPLIQLPRRVTGITPSEVAEGGAKPESEPTFEQIPLQPYELGVITPATKVLLEDSTFDLSSYLGGHIAERFGELEAQWFINGNGTTQPEGVMTSADVPEETVAEIDPDALIDTYYGLKANYRSNASWLMNADTLALIRKLKDTDGRMIWQPALAAGQPETILGRPVLEAVDMPNPISGNSPIIFGDFRRGYTVADRIGLEIMRDEYTGAANNIVKFHARRRVGGRVVMPEALSKVSVA